MWQPPKSLPQPPPPPPLSLVIDPHVWGGMFRGASLNPKTMVGVGHRWYAHRCSSGDMG